MFSGFVPNETVQNTRPGAKTNLEISVYRRLCNDSKSRRSHEFPVVPTLRHKQDQTNSTKNLIVHPLLLKTNTNAVLTYGQTSLTFFL